jgi:serine/threonine-protein kinase
MPLTPGTRLGPYEIVGPLGAGGMGEVYRARDSKLNRDVALKVLPASVAGDPERLARFRREAQVLASLNHPNIGQIYGFEDSGAIHALVLELVEGPTLADRIASGPLALNDALPIAKQIAEALEAAHESGIIHRDLKPANVKVRDDGTVKVLDFGLAKALAPESSPGQPNPSNSPTLTARASELGLILGTAAYMAPEQAKGRTVDKRADIWAFGVVLYEMIAGRRGYEAEDVSDTLAAVLTREVDWAALPAGTPPRVRALVRDCLVRDPKQRLRDIGDARRAIEQVISGAPDVAAPPPAAAIPAAASSKGRLVPWMIAAIAVLAAAAMAWRQFRPAPAPPAAPVTRARMPLKDLSGFVNVSRDGTKLVYTVSGGPSGFSLALRALDQFEGKLVPGADGALFPLFSPDGQWIAYSGSSQNKIRKIPITGGTSITLCDGTLGYGGAWGEDDTIVFGGPKGLLRVPAGGGTPQPLTTLDGTKNEAAHTRPQFLPGGRQLLFTIVTAGSAEGPQFAVLDLQTNKYRTVVRGGDNGRYVASSRESGHLTFVRDATLFAVPFDLARLTVTGAEAPVVEGISTVGPQGTGDYSSSDDGVLVYSENLSQQGTVLAWANRQGVVQPVPGQVPRKWGTGRLSPDGLRVANAIEGDKGWDIWIADLQRTTMIRLTFGGDNDLPVWTPDGLRVVYGGAVDGKRGIYSVLADGSSRPELVLATDSAVTPSSITPDGKALLYSQLVDGRSRILVLPLAGDAASRQPHPLHDASGGEGDAQVSPDGHWVAFASSETGSSEIYVLSIDGSGGKVRVSTQGGRNPRWARSGRELFYWSNSPGNAQLFAAAVQVSPSLQVGATQGLFQFAPGTTWDVAPDGTKFLVEATSLGGGSVFATVTNWFDELRRRAPAKK